MSRSSAGRLVALFALMAFAFGAISVRLVVLAVSQAQELQDRAFDQRVRTIDLPAQRGQILDRNGARLALSTPADDVYADPQLVDDPWERLRACRPCSASASRILVHAMTSDRTFVYLTRPARRRADRIQRLALPGIGLLPTSKRSYPAGSARLSGARVRRDGRGGSHGPRARVPGRPRGHAGGADERARPLGPGNRERGRRGRAPVEGANVVTTIDRELQFQAQAALEQAVEEQGARGGTVIVMDPRTAEVRWRATPGSTRTRSRTRRAPPIATEPRRTPTNPVRPTRSSRPAAIKKRAIPSGMRLTVPWTMPVGDYIIHGWSHDRCR